MERKHIYTTLSDEEFEILDTAIEQLGFTSRTDYFTASAHVLIYGRNPYEWNTALNTLWQKNELMKKTFFDTVHEKAFPIIAMNGTGAFISAGISRKFYRIFRRCCRIYCSGERMTAWFKIEALRERDKLLAELNSGLTKADLKRKYSCSITSVDRAIKFHGIDYDKIKLLNKRRV